MTEDCVELRKEFNEREEKCLNLFKESERIHQLALQFSYSKRVELMTEAFAKQREAIEEIKIIAKTQKKLKEEQCEETEHQVPNL